MSILRLVASHAWRYQSLPDPLPSPLAENEYVAPATKGQLTSNDQRKNYTGLQETAQWLSGVDIPAKMLEALGVGGLSAALNLSTRHLVKIVNITKQRQKASNNNNNNNYYYYYCVEVLSQSPLQFAITVIVKSERSPKHAKYRIKVVCSHMYLICTA